MVPMQCQIVVDICQFRICGTFIAYQQKGIDFTLLDFQGLVRADDLQKRLMLAIKVSYPKA
jgi:hypothetical protein